MPSAFAVSPQAIDTAAKVGERLLHLISHSPEGYGIVCGDTGKTHCTGGSTDR